MIIMHVRLTHIALINPFIRMKKAGTRGHRMNGVKQINQSGSLASEFVITVASARDIIKDVSSIRAVESNPQPRNM